MPRSGDILEILGIPPQAASPDGKKVAGLFYFQAVNASVMFFVQGIC